MVNFEDAVPFDPGYSAISFSFLGHIDMFNEEYARLKASHQKKFWLTKNESLIVEVISKTCAFYLGCILWGGFAHFRFIDAPKPISGNNTLSLSKDEKAQIDCTVEVKEILEYLVKLNRDFKYFLGRPAKFSPLIKEILDNYIEFSQLNNNFTEVKSTADIKTPQVIAHFAKLGNEKLDELCEKIYSTIESAKIENLLQIGFYK